VRLGRQRRKIMNKAQKRTWISLVISLAGISLGATAITLIKIMQLDIANTDHHTALRLVSLPLTIPLISMVILSWRLPTKGYDERDKEIDRKSTGYGIIGAFVFLGAAVLVLGIMSPLGSMKIFFLSSLVYFAFFVSVMVSSVAALIQYGQGGEVGK
ncbi:MAG: hypothetical protein ACYSTZ_11675, partial [Planctomycetota bacterium]